MTPKEIDDILNRAAPPADVDPRVLEGAKRPVLTRLSPVRPLPPTWIFIAAFLIVFGAIIAAGALLTGVNGWRALDVGERAAIFTILIALACFASIACTREMRPAGGRSVSVAAFAIAVGGLLAMFALLFRDYGMQKFVPQGVPCLVTGLSFAFFAALLGVLLVRRGFVLNLVAAGIAVGTFAGLSGIGVLELHCANLKAGHVMFWHVAVVVISALLVGRVFATRRRSMRA